MFYTLEQLCSDGLPFCFQYLLPVARGRTTISYGEIAEKLARDLDVGGPVFRPTLEA